MIKKKKTFDEIFADEDEIKSPNPKKVKLLDKIEISEKVENFLKDTKFNEKWKKSLEIEFSKPYFENLVNLYEKETNELKKTIFPPKEKIFNAINFCSFEDIKVVIIGQDPYHGDNQANGFSFSVAKGIKVPSSLQNIFKEVVKDTGKKMNPEKCGDLTKWAEQGVVMLNTCLTVEKAKPGSHAKKWGWEQFTDALIQKIAMDSKNVVFMLWGLFAHKKTAIIERFSESNNHLILKSSHPSGFSYLTKSAKFSSFCDNQHFKKCNEFLSQNGLDCINWTDL